MAVAFREVVTTTQATAVVTWTVSGPTATTQAGDFLLLASSDGNPGTVTTPTGWTPFPDTTEKSADGVMHLFYKWATAADIGATFNYTHNAATGGIAAIASYSGVNPITPFGAVFQQGTASATAQVMTMKPYVGQGMSVAVMAFDPTLTALTATWGTFTERVDLETGTLGYLTLADGPLTSSASFSETCTLSSTESSANAMIELIDAAVNTSFQPSISPSPRRPFAMRRPFAGGRQNISPAYDPTAITSLSFNAVVGTMTLSQAAAVAAEIFTSPANSMTLSQAATALAQTFLASPAMLMTLSQAPVTPAIAIDAGTASLLTMSQAPPTFAAFILSASSLMTLSQAVTALTTTFQSVNSTMTLSQAAAAAVESVSAGTASLLTMSQATPAEVAVASFTSPSSTVTLGAAPATLVESVQAAANSLTMSQGTPQLSATITSTPAALLTLGAAGVTLDLGSLTFNAPNNTMTLSMGPGISLDLGGGTGTGHGNIAWYILDRRRRENQ